MIIEELKKGKFSRGELEFIKIFMNRIIEATDKLLNRKENSDG